MVKSHGLLFVVLEHAVSVVYGSARSVRYHGVAAAGRRASTPDNVFVIATEYLLHSLQRLKVPPSLCSGSRECYLPLVLEMRYMPLRKYGGII